MGILDFLIRDPMEMTFKNFIKNLERKSGREYALAFRDKVLDLLLKDKTLLYSDIEKMKWKDVSYKIRSTERQTRLELETLNTIIEKSVNVSKEDAFFLDPSWQYGLENVSDEDDMK